jgi:hypothetical protein
MRSRLGKLAELRTLAAEAHAAIVLRQIDHEALNRFYMHFTPVQVVGLLDELLLELIEPAERPLVLAPAEPQPDAPTDIAQLPDYWDERRKRQGKPDLSRCAAELRIALRAKGGERG